MLVVLCFLWGVTWPIMRIALYEIPPLSMRTLTAALGALTLYLACRLQGRSLRLPNAKSWAHVTIASLLNIVAFTVFGSFAQLTAATSRVTILAYTMPIWAVLLAWLFLGERPNRTQSFALALCASGLAILIYPLAETKIAPGIWLALVTGLSWAGGTVYLKWAQIEADPMSVASWQVTIAFVVTAALMLIFEGRSACRRRERRGAALHRVDRLLRQRRRLWTVVRDHSPSARRDGFARRSRQSRDRRCRLDPDLGRAPDSSRSCRFRLDLCRVHLRSAGAAGNR